MATPSGSSSVVPDRPFPGRAAAPAPGGGAQFPPKPTRRGRSRGRLLAVVGLVLAVGGGGYLWYQQTQPTAATSTGRPSPASASTSSAGITRQVVGAVRLDLPRGFVPVKDAPATVKKAFGNASVLARSTETISVVVTKLAAARAVAKYPGAARKKQGDGWQAELAKRAAARGKSCQGPKVGQRADFSKATYFGTDLTLTCKNKDGVGQTERHRFLVVGDGDSTEVTVSASTALWAKDKALLEPIIGTVLPKG